MSRLNQSPICSYPLNENHNESLTNTHYCRSNNVGGANDDYWNDSDSYSYYNSHCSLDNGMEAESQMPLDMLQLLHFFYSKKIPPKKCER